MKFNDLNSFLKYIYEKIKNSQDYNFTHLKLNAFKVRKIKEGRFEILGRGCIF